MREPIMADGAESGATGTVGRAGTGHGKLTNSKRPSINRLAATGGAGSWQQFKALFATNMTNISRNREQLVGEGFNTVLYIGLLVGFSYTTSYTTTPAGTFFPPPANFTPRLTIKDPGFGFLCHSTGAYEPCCVTAEFGDTSAGDGCSAELATFIAAALPICDADAPPPSQFSDSVFLGGGIPNYKKHTHYIVYRRKKSMTM